VPLLANRQSSDGVPVDMTTDRTRFRHPIKPAYFLGRPSSLYVERYRRSNDPRR
jgi:hypothetical protein